MTILRLTSAALFAAAGLGLAGAAGAAPAGNLGVDQQATRSGDTSAATPVYHRYHYGYYRPYYYYPRYYYRPYPRYYGYYNSYPGYYYGPSFGFGFTIR